MFEQLFEYSYEKLIAHEGGYSNHVADGGGETYKGISRIYFPKWGGWALIDNHDLNHLDCTIGLAELVKAFYKKEFWDKLKLNVFPKGFENLQFELFDTGVNTGKKQAVKLLQRSLNILNRNEQIVKDLIVDGIIGNQTISVVDKYNKEAEYLFKLFVLFKAKIYIDILENNHSQEVFARGWINRIQLNEIN